MTSKRYMNAIGKRKKEKNWKLFVCKKNLIRQYKKSDENIGVVCINVVREYDIIVWNRERINTFGAAKLKYDEKLSHFTQPKFQRKSNIQIRSKPRNMVLLHLRKPFLNFIFFLYEPRAGSSWVLCVAKCIFSEIVRLIVF